MTPAELAPHESAAASGGSSGDAPEVPAQPGPADLPGPLLTSGASADVYAIDEHTVLRRYRGGRDATREVELLRLVTAHGYPAPAVDSSHGADLVLQRLHGPTLLQALAAGEVSLADGAAVLVDLHDRLHAVPVPDAPGACVVHLDLHPGNVILSEELGPAVVDWALAGTGSAELDVAVTALLVAEVAVDAGGDYSQAARALLAAFLAHSTVSAVAALDEAVLVRRADPGLVAGEAALVDAAAGLVRDLVALTS